MTKPHRFRIVTPAALAFALLASFGCGNKPAAASANPFPESNPAQGWTRTDDIRTFPAAELWKYIDGDAEKYLKAGVESTSTSDYKFHENFEAVVDIFTMSTPAGAKTIFDSEPSLGASTPQLGDAARLYEQSLVFRQGKYLVRIVAYQSSPLLAQGLLDLGKRIDERLTK
ncbi:MAG TPA: DUF6599 family protein [Candidatus Acidoferrum sp.]|jgi:hypothetical protein